MLYSTTKYASKSLCSDIFEFLGFAKMLASPFSRVRTAEVFTDRRTFTDKGID